MARRQKETSLSAPYLKRIWLDDALVTDKTAYPYSLPLLQQPFELRFEHPITIFIGENGAGKSTLLEGIAAVAGYDESGGGKGHRPVDHSRALDKSGSALAKAFRAAWLPKVTNGWFFRAESFFSVARYLDEAALDGGGAPPDYLSQSHGEGFLTFFEERCQRQGIYIFDEPESALSPMRQLEFLKLLRRMELSRRCQVIMATHSTLLMAYPGAALLQVTQEGLIPADVERTEHFRIMREFCDDPALYIETVLADV